MGRSALDKLQEVTQGATSSETPEEKIAALTESFELFSRETARLEGAYRSLQAQFLSVNLQLEQTNRKLNSILGNMTQGILFVGLSGEVATCNPAAERILDVCADEVVDSRYWDRFSDGLFGFSMQGVLATRQTPQASLASIEHDDGTKKELEISTTFVLQGDPSMHGLIVLVRDITEIRRLQVVASRNDRLKELGEMAASVAHEIRNPLGGIKGFASLLCRDLEDRPHLAQMAQYIVEGTTALDNLVTNVLNYSRPMQLTQGPTDVVALLHAVDELARADANLCNEDTTIAVEAAEAPLTASLDSALFKSAILNLIVNAVQAMPNGGAVTLSARQEDKQALITVSDTGEGIAAENLEKVFSPFFTTKSEGNGFGLSEVHKIIEAHSGTIEVQSELGQGTVFTIKLPLG